MVEILQSCGEKEPQSIIRLSGVTLEEVIMRQVTIRIEDETYEYLKQLSKCLDWTISQTARTMLNKVVVETLEQLDNEITNSISNIERKLEENNAG